MNYSRQQIVRFLYLFGLAGLLISLPFSNFLMSSFQFFLLGAWLICGDLSGRLKGLKSNIPVLLLVSLFVMHIVGLAWTTDFNYAINDIRIKLPLILLPVVLSSGPKICRKTFDTLLLLFTTAVLAASLISFSIFLSDDYRDIRDISVFISHIRFSLLICLSVFILFYYILNNHRLNLLLRIYSLISAIWLTVFLYILDSLTGISVMIITGLTVMLYVLIKHSGSLAKILIATGMAVLISFISLYLYSISRDFITYNDVDFSKLETHTASGNPYIHDTLSQQRENGNYVYLYINVDELREGWNGKSELDYDGVNRKGQVIQDILIRYLSSKGLRKDSVGIEALDIKDITAVENGITNYLMLEKLPLSNRIYQVLWEYQHYTNTGNPSGHSVMQRIEYLKAALEIARKNLLLGVGTGDLQLEFDKQYVEMNSSLDKEWRLRAHNQYVTMLIAFGIPGLLLFILALFYPPLKNKAFKDYFFFVFFVIALLSMLNEDTLETQAGVTFFAVFYSFFLFVRDKNIGHDKLT